MARRSFLVTLIACAALAASAAAVGADGGAGRGPVYGGWTTPQTGGYGTWTTPRPSGYGTWTTPATGGYGTWSSTSGSPRSYGSPASPSIPATATVITGSGTGAGWSSACPPPCPPACPAVATIEAPCSPDAWRFGVRGRYWMPSISGSTLITLGGEPGSGTSVDVDDDLDLDRGDGWEGGVSVAYGRHRATLGYESNSFSGSSTLDRTIIFHGMTFLAGTEIESDLDLTCWKLGYDYAFVSGASNSSGVTVRGGLSAWLWDYEGRVRSDVTSQDTSRGFSHVFPVATLEAEGRFNWLHLGARLAGGALADDRYVIDAEASVGVTLGSVASFDVGYRWMNLSFDETTNEGDLTLYGPFAGLSIVF